MASTSGESTPLLGAGTPPKVNPTQITSDVYMLSPAQDGLGRPEDPKVILIFGWMDAKLRSLITYMTRYNALYPGATQVLVLSKQSSAWSSKGTNWNAVRPAESILKDLGVLGDSPPSIITHVFSNGGGQQLVTLSALLHRDAEAITTYPANCLILDSLPGNAGFITSLRAFTAPIKSLPMKVLAAIPLSIIWFVLVGLASLIGKKDVIQILREELQRPDILPWMNTRTPRVYVYSKEDLMVPSYSVEEHIAVAKSHQGYPVTAEIFHRSPHVAHAKTDPERYWAIVRNAWAQALDVQASNVAAA